MVGYTFIGVFSGSAPSKKATPTGEPALWNVYLKNGEKNYLIQKLDEDNIVTKEQYQISSIYFGINFRKVKNPNSDLNINRNIKNLTEKENTTDKNSDPEKIKAAYNALMKQKKENIEKAKNQTIDQKNVSQQTIEEKETNTEIEIKKQSSNEQSINAIKQNKTDKQEESKQTLSQQDFKINLNSQYFSKEEIMAKKKAQSEKTKISLSVSQPKPKKNQDSNYLPNVRHSDSHAVSDQNPYDEKFSTEKFGFDSILKKVEKAQNTPNKNLIPIRNSSVKPSPITSQTKSEILNNKNLTTLPKESITNQEVDDQPFAIEIEDVITEIESNNDAVNNVIETTTEEENSGEVLLQAKGNKSATSLSEKAKRLDNQIRAEFQMSLNHWNSLKRNLARKQFHMLINKDAAFVPAHKHTFTDFAIQLRKLNLHDIALAAAIRCTKLSPDDSHAFFNVARLYFELNRFEQANDFIDKTLQLEQDLIPAQKLSFIIKECLRRKAMNK